jgi:hypothetical protein
MARDPLASKTVAIPPPTQPVPANKMMASPTSTPASAKCHKRNDACDGVDQLWVRFDQPFAEPSSGVLAKSGKVAFLSTLTISSSTADEILVVKSKPCIGLGRLEEELISVETLRGRQLSCTSH